ERRGANRSGRAVENRAVRRRAAGEVAPLDDALEPLAAAGADDVDTLTVGEDRRQHVFADLRSFGALRHARFAADARRRHVGLLEVAVRRFVRLRRRLLDEAELNRLVAVGLR